MVNMKNIKDLTNKEERQAYILDIISNGEIITTHKEVLKRLEDMGFYVGLSAIQRDFKSLKLQKHNGKYVIDEALEKIRLEKILSTILNQSNSNTIYPSSFFTIQSDEGFEVLTAKRIKETFFEYILGYIVGDGIVIFFTDDDDLSKHLCSEIKRIKDI